MKVERYYDVRQKKRLWRFDVTVGGHRFRKNGFKTRADAEEVIDTLKYANRVRKFGLPERPASTTLAELLDERAKDQNSSRPGLTARLLTELIAVCPKGIALTELRKQHFRALTDRLREKGLKPSSINLYLSYVSSAIHDACEYFSGLDDWTPPKISKVSGATNRDRVLSREELGRLFTALNQSSEFTEIADVLRLMLLTCARRIEIRKLHAASINKDWRYVQLRETKNKSNRVVPLSATAQAILSKYSEPILSKLPDPRFYEQIAEVSQAAGLLYGDKEDGGWVPHDLRHTGATVIESAGVRYSVVAALLGHKRKDQTATYTHASLEDLRKAVEVLEIWCREIDGFAGNSECVSVAM